MYALRILTDTEKHYAQIEREALGVTLACERFNNYLLREKFHIYTDYKFLVPLLGHKNLDELTVKIQCFRVSLMRYHFTCSWPRFGYR